MITIYCISGLGTDGRVFRRLSIPGVRFQYVPWPHADRHDEMACYAQKVAALIPQGPDDHILGLSFGGMLASEIALIRPEQKVFLVSSAKSPLEMPPVSRLVHFIGKHHLIPISTASIFRNRLMDLFGAETEDEQELILEVLDQSDPHLVRCSVKMIVDWQMRTAPRKDIVHIHGTADKMILPQNVHPTHWIDGGHHLMIYSRAAEVSALIAQHLT